MCAYIILYFSATDTPVSHLRRGEWGERRGDYESAIIFTISINVPIDKPWEHINDIGRSTVRT